MRITSTDLHLGRPTLSFASARRAWAYAHLLKVTSLVCCALLGLSVARAEVGGTRQTLYRQHQVFGGAVVTGNTLMRASLADPLVNSQLLPSSPGDINNIPSDSSLVGAYLFWSGSTLNGPDATATLSLPDGTTLNVVAPEQCFTLQSFGGFYACRADVTSALQPHPGARSYNGRYTVGDVRAQPGQLNGDGSCVNPQTCQAKYAAWSLVLVYESPNSTTLRDISLYDGFLSLDENAFSPGIESFSIEGFDFPTNGTASLSYFAMEGDALLGVPPQDSDPLPQLRCATCFDFFEVNGTKLNDANNPPNNVFNSSSSIGYTLGVDLDTFDISALLSPGDSRINLRVGSGDGVVNPNNPDPGGGGELFLLSYVLLNVDRNAPNFSRSGTTFDAVPDEAAPLERVVLTLRLDNEGSLAAQGVRVQSQLPAGLSYFPGSLRIDGADPIPGEEAVNPLRAGLQLGVIPFQGDTDRVITLRASIDEGTPAGTRLRTLAEISATNIPEVVTKEAIVTVLGTLPLAQPLKEVSDGNGDGSYEPGELIQYRVTIRNPNARPASGVQLIDDLPPYLDVLQVVAGGGQDLSDLSRNRVQIDGLNIPAQSDLTITIIAVIHDAEQLIADGVPAGEIDGWVIDNQASVTLGADRQLTDDPSSPNGPDATRLILDAGVDIRGSGTRKLVSDLNGGLLEPGDPLRYTIRVRNTGVSPGQVQVDDPLPPSLTSCAIDAGSEALRCEVGANGAPRVVGTVDIEADDIVNLSFTVAVADSATDGQLIQNVATLSVVGDPEQVVVVRSPQLRVVSAPILTFLKRSLTGPQVSFAGELTYDLSVTNAGNLPAEQLAVTDPILIPVDDVTTGPGASWDPSSRTVTWVIGDLAVGETKRVTLTLALSDEAEPGSRLSNQASLSGLGVERSILSDDPTTATERDPTVVLVTSEGPILSVTKRPSTRAPLSGEEVSYTVDVLNIGDQPALSVRVTDLFDPTSFAEVSAPQGMVNGTSVTISPSSLPALARVEPGQTVSFTISGRLQSLPVGATVSNQLFVTATSPSGQSLEAESDDPSTPATGDPTTLTIASPPTLLLTKRVEDLNGGLVEPGDVLRYSVTARLEGQRGVNSVRVFDPIPEGLTNIAPLDGGQLIGDQLTWEVGSLSLAGQPSITVRFEAQVSTGLPHQSLISNQARLTATELAEALLSDDPDTPATADPTSVRVSSLPDLRVTKLIEPPEASPGERVRWTIEVENVGRGRAVGVSISDPLSQLLLDAEAIGGQVSGGVASWRLPALAPQERRRFTLETQLSPEASSDLQVFNQATVTASAEGENDTPFSALSDDPRTPEEGDPTALNIIDPPPVALRKSVIGEPFAQAGGLVRYRLELENTSTALRSNIILTDILPTGATVTDAGGGEVNAQSVVWTIPSLNPSQLISFELELRVPEELSPGDVVANQASALAPNMPLTLSDDPSTAEPSDATLVTIIGEVRVDLSKSVRALDTPAYQVGGLIEYQLTLTHAGSAPASDLVITDPLPSHLEAVGVSAGTLSGAPGAQTWIVSLPSLAPQATATYTLTARLRPSASAGDEVSNRASLSVAELSQAQLSDDPATPERDATRFIVNGGLEVSVTKLLTSENPAQVGEQVSYLINLINEGARPTEALTLEDALSPRLLNAVASVETGVGVSATVTGQVARWLIPSMAPGQLISLRLTATLDPSATSGEQILNQAELLGAEGVSVLSDDPVTPTSGDPTSLTVSARAELQLLKRASASSGSFSAGTQVTYALTLSNVGAQPARELLISDPLPAGLTFTSARPSGSFDPNTRLITWSLDALSPGESQELSLTASINEGLTTGEVISNQATVSALSSSPSLSDDPSTSTPNDPTRFEVAPPQTLSLTKEIVDVNGPPLKPGDLVEFSLTTRNNSTDALDDIELFDPLSPLLTSPEAIGGDVSGGVARWRILRLEPSQERTFVLRARVSEQAQDGALVTNQFAARPPSGETSLSNEIVEEVTTTQLRVLKTVTPVGSVAFTPGGNLEYTITLLNTGASPALDLIIEDPAPAQLRDLQAEGARIQGSTIQWDSASLPALASVAPGELITLRVTARISEEVPLGAELLNQAVVSDSLSSFRRLSDDPSTEELDDPTRLLVESVATLIFTKDITRPVNREDIQPMDELEYELVIQNNGLEMSGPLRLFDVLDPRLRARTLTVDGVSRDPSELDLLGVSLRSLAPRERVVAQLTVVLLDTEPGTLIPNQATVLFEAGGVELNSDDPTTTTLGDPTSFVVGGASDLQVIKRAEVTTPDGGVSVGELITWTIEVINLGSTPQPLLKLSDVLPVTTTLLTDSVTVNGRLVAPPELRLVTPPAPSQEAFELRLINLEPGQRHTIVFQTTAVAPPQAVNQATISTPSGVVYLSDNNDQLSDGVMPTAVTIRERPVKGYKATLSMEDLNEPPAQLGDDLIGRVIVENTGTLDLQQLTLRVPIPRGLLWGGVSVEGDSAGAINPARFVPAQAPSPGAPPSALTGEAFLEDFSLKAGERLSFVMRLKVDPQLEQSQALCAQALLIDLTHQAGEDEGEGSTQSEQVCVEGEVVFGAVSGRVFQDLDADGLLGEGDLSFEGMIISAWPLGQGEGPPLATDFSSEDGSYRLNNLRPGQYEVRLKSAQGVSMRAKSTVEVVALSEASLALTIEPSGRVYQSTDGALIDGAEVFIYHDRDVDDDPFDEESLAQRELVSPEDLESATQQGQRTAQGGLYRLGVKRPGRYLIEVIPPSVQLIAPSSLVPPMPNVLTPEGGALVASADPLPSVDQDADRRYFMAFEVRGDLERAEQLKGNHIPLDPSSALIQVDKRSLKTDHLIGEVVTYEVDVINRSSRSFIYDPRSGLGGVLVQDALPKGLKYIPGSALWLEVFNGRERPLFSSEPVGVRLLSFGRQVPRSSGAGGGLIQRSIDLKAGAHLRLRYQVALGVNVKPQRSYTNRATLITDGNVPLSLTAKAQIRVLSDPDFDQGLLIGRVWCDQDENGALNDGERGLPGARLYLDNGTYVVTDSAGKFHFKQIEPGVHAVKLDTNSLPPGGALTTDLTRVIYFTRGLPAKVDFGATCPAETLAQPEVSLGERALKAALSALGKEAVIIEGDSSTLSVQIEELSFKAPDIDVKLIAPTDLIINGAEDTPDLLPPTDGGVLPLSFIPSGLDKLKDAPLRWSLWVGPVGAESQPVLQGAGLPPAQLDWSGYDAMGQPLSKRGQLLMYHLELAFPDLIVGSQVRHFGVGVTLPPEPELLQTFQASAFDGSGGYGRRVKTRTLQLLSEQDKQRVEEVLTRLKAGYTGRLLIEAHSAGERDSGSLTAQRAELIAELIRERLSLKATEVRALGSGDESPLVPNLTYANQRRNRRVEVRLERLEADPEALKRFREPLRFTPIARAGADERRPNEQGRFVITSRLPQSGLIEVFMRDQRGRKVTFSVPLQLASRTAQLNARATELSVAGSLGESLSVGGRSVKLNTPPPQVKAGMIGTDIVFKPSSLPDGLSAWALTVQSEAGEVLLSESGRGQPEARYRWSPSPDMTGVVSATLKVSALIDGVGLEMTSAPLRLRMRKAKAGLLRPLKGSWSARFNKQALKVSEDLKISEVLKLSGDTTSTLSITSPDGAQVSLTLPMLVNEEAPRPLSEPLSAQKTAPQSRRSGERSDARKGPLSRGPLWVGGGEAWSARRAGASPVSVALNLPSDLIDPYVSTQPSAPAPEERGGPTQAQTDPVARPYDLLSPAPRWGTFSGRPAGDQRGAPQLGPQPMSKKEAVAPRPQSIPRFGATELLKALTPTLTQNAPKVIAQELEAELPQGDSLTSLEVAIRGKTNPANRVWLNGREVRVDESGAFTGLAQVTEEGLIELRSLDPDGNQGRLQKRYTVSDQAWFLLAMGESVTGTLGAELDGVQAHTSTRMGDVLYVHGRAAVYLKGRVKGDELLGGLFKRYEVTAHLDSARRQELTSYFRQMIDPERFYPVYGDSAQEVNDVNSRGPVYVLVKADRSALVAGNFRTQIRGVELLNYDRTLYGAQVDLKLDQGDLKHELKAFGADQDQPERHAYVELRGTGGSLYYLPHRELVEGSERLYLVERDKISNIERRRVALARNIDYSVRYQEGRILMSRPVTSSNFDTIGALPQPTGSQSTLDGHPIFLSVEYDHRDATDRGEQAWGVFAKESWKDRLSVGAGLIQERQGDVGQDHYRLWGANLQAKHGRKTHLALEYAKSNNVNGENLFSQDGGLTFTPFSLRDGRDAQGEAFLARAGVELNDLMGDADQDTLYIEGYWRYAAPGFYAGGNLQQQGMENVGLMGQYWLNERHSFVMKYDRVAAEQPTFEQNPFLREFERTVTRISHVYTLERLKIESAWTHTVSDEAGQGLMLGSQPGALTLGAEQSPSYTTDALSVSVERPLSARLTLLAEQEVVVRGDSRLYQETSDLLVTSIGARYKLSNSLQIEAIESLRWSGDNATQVGVRSELSEGRTVYAQQRFIDQFGQESYASVVGAEERFGQGARAYSEYQLESGQLGLRNRAILGVGKRTQLSRGLTIDAGYQRSQILSSSGAGGLNVGSDLSQDALMAGFEWLLRSDLKATGRVELRFDDHDDWTGRRDQQQYLAMGAVSYLAHPDLTLQLRVNFSETEDLIFKATSASFLDASFGAAYRPLDSKWLAVLFKVAKRFELRPVDLAVEDPTSEESDVVSLTPIVELPFGFQLVEKLAFKRYALKTPTLPVSISHTLLWINRLNYHLTGTWDIGGEYRFMQNDLSQSLAHGALFEVNYIIQDAVRVGLGYNFTSFSDDEFARLDERYGGPFLRVVAHY